MGKHNAVGEVSSNPPARRRLFDEKHLPHWAMAALTAMWGYFQFKLGTDGVPPALNQAFGGISGAWFAYVLRRAMVDTKPSEEAQ